MVTRALVVLVVAGVLLGTAAAASTELTLQNFDEKVPPHAGVRARANPLPHGCGGAAAPTEGRCAARQVLNHERNAIVKFYAPW